MKAKHLFKELGYFAFCLSGAFLIASLALSLLPMQPASAANGAIWTTTSACGTEGQDINHFAIGEHVFINGNNFDADTSYDWTITGKPGGASSDPGIIVASGNEVTDGAGAFCVDAYIVAADDDGEYAVDFGGKGDNYRVDGSILVPTDTQTPSDTPTITSTSTSTNTPTNTPSGTVIAPTATNTSTNTPSGTFVVPTSTKTPTITPTGTYTPPATKDVPISPTTTDTPVPATSTITPDPGTPTPIPIPASPSGSDGSNVVFPVTGVDLGTFSRGLPVAFANLCLGFLGLGLILQGIARRVK